MLVGAVVLPHGDLILKGGADGLSYKQKAQAEELGDAAQRAGQFLAETQPDVVLLSTPHGIAELDSFSYYLNPSASGSLPPGGPEAFCSVSLDTEGAQGLLQSLRSRGLDRCIGLSGYGPPGQADAPFPLAWGEVIPLVFLPEGLRAAAKFIILSQPSRRYTDAAQMVPELQVLGAALFDILEELPQRVAVLVSADPAHTHDADGPYGFSEDAAPFDAAIAKWLRTVEPEHLLGEAASRVEGAKSCGFTGLVMLQGMLSQAAAGAAGTASGSKGRVARQAFESRLLAIHHPTYYGMAVATMRRIGWSRL